MGSDSDVSDDGWSEESSSSGEVEAKGDVKKDDDSNAGSAVDGEGSSADSSNSGDGDDGTEDTVGDDRAVTGSSSKEESGESRRSVDSKGEQKRKGEKSRRKDSGKRSKKDLRSSKKSSKKSKHHKKERKGHSTSNRSSKSGKRRSTISLSALSDGPEDTAETRSDGGDDIGASGDGKKLRSSTLRRHAMLREEHRTNSDSSMIPSSGVRKHAARQRVTYSRLSVSGDDDDSAETSSPRGENGEKKKKIKYTEEEAAAVVVRALRCWRGCKADRTEFRKVRRQHRRRTQAAQELLETEETYVKSLNLLCRCYLGPFSNAEKIVSEAEVTAIFSDAELIKGLNEKLLGKLRATIGGDNWTPYRCFGEVLGSFAQFFRLYANYMQNYPNALETLKAVRADSKRKADFEAMIKECRIASDTLLDLESFLIMPVQRIPRYSMLINEVLKNTDPSHPDYNDLETSLEQIKSVAGSINTELRSVELNNRVAEIDHRLRGLPEGKSLQKNGRKLEKEVVVLVHDEQLLSKKGSRVGFEVMNTFVFTDMLIWASAREDSHLLDFIRQDYRTDLAASDRAPITIKYTSALSQIEAFKSRSEKVGAKLELPAISVMSLTNSAITLSFVNEAARDSFRQILNDDAATIEVGGQEVSNLAISRERSWENLQASVHVQKTSALVKRVQADVRRSTISKVAPPLEVITSPDNSPVPEKRKVRGHFRRKSTSNPDNTADLDVHKVVEKKDKGNTMRSKFRTLTFGRAKGAKAEAKLDFHTKKKETWWAEWDSVRLSAQFEQWKRDHPNKPLPPLPTSSAAPAISADTAAVNNATVARVQKKIADRQMEESLSMGLSEPTLVVKASGAPPPRPPRTNSGSSGSPSTTTTAPKQQPTVPRPRTNSAGKAIPGPPPKRAGAGSGSPVPKRGPPGPLPKRGGGRGPGPALPKRPGAPKTGPKLGPGPKTGPKVGPGPKTGPKVGPGPKTGPKVGPGPKNARAKVPPPPPKRSPGTPPQPKNSLTGPPAVRIRPGPPPGPPPKRGNTPPV